MAITRAQQVKQMLKQGGRTGFFSAGLARGDDISPGTSTSGGNKSGGGGKGRDLDYQMSGGKKGSTFETYRGGKNIGVDNTLAAKYGNKEQKEKANKALAKGNLYSTSPNQSFFEKANTTRTNYNLKKRRDYINRILKQRQKKISAGLFDIENMPGVDLMETEDYFDFAPSITDFGPQGTGKYSQQFVDDVLSGKRKPPEFFSKIDVGTVPGLATKGLATVANLFGTKMAGPVTREELERLNKEKMEIMNLDPSKTTVEEMMETYEPNRFKLLNAPTGGEGENISDPCKGPNPPAYCFIGSKADETMEAAVTRNLSGLTPRIGGSKFDFTQFAADGGRIGLFKGAQADASAGKGAMSPGTDAGGGFRGGGDDGPKGPTGGGGTGPETFQMVNPTFKKSLFDKQLQLENFINKMELENRLKEDEENQEDVNYPTSGIFLDPKLDEKKKAEIFQEFKANGGRAGLAGGGIASLEDMDREGFLLGGIAKGLKKAVRGVKKLAKSPIGKAALVGAGFGLAGIGPMANLFSSGKGLAFKQLLLGGKTLPPSMGFKSKGLLGLIKANPIPSIFAVSALAGLTAKKDDDEFDLASYYAQNQLDPSLSIKGMGSDFDYDFYGARTQPVADGGRIGYQEG